MGMHRADRAPQREWQEVALDCKRSQFCRTTGSQLLAGLSFESPPWQEVWRIRQSPGLGVRGLDSGPGSATVLCHLSSQFPPL